MSTAKEVLKQFLMEHGVGEIDMITKSQHKDVVELESHLSPIEAAEILWKNNIVGAPVWDNQTKKYVGFFEMRDILSSVIATEKSEEEEHDPDSVKFDRYNEHMVKELTDSHAGGGKRKFADAYPSDHTISYLAARNHFYYCRPHAKLSDLCEFLNKRHCHRVPILNAEDRCQSIVTQTALISFIADNYPRDKLKETIKEAKIPYKKKVFSVPDTVPASEAFTLLDNKRLSGIAVVDEDGKLIGNTSARDIKLAAFDEGKTAMHLDILSYLARVRQAVTQKKERYPCCHVHEDATVANVIELLAKTGYHRVFVVDDDIRPIGVISVSDITAFATDDDTSSCCM